MIHSNVFTFVCLLQAMVITPVIAYNTLRLNLTFDRHETCIFSTFPIHSNEYFFYPGSIHVFAFISNL